MRGLRSARFFTFTFSILTAFSKGGIRALDVFSTASLEPTMFCGRGLSAVLVVTEELANSVFAGAVTTGVDTEAAGAAETTGAEATGAVTFVLTGALASTLGVTAGAVDVVLDSTIDTTGLAAARVDVFFFPSKKPWPLYSLSSLIIGTVSVPSPVFFRSIDWLTF